MARPRRGLEMGILMLLWKFAETGLENVPAVTLLTIATQVGLYMGLIPVSWDAVTVCLSAQAVLKWREYERLLLSALEHGDDLHLYYNMVSFLFKGRTLEHHFGGPYFAYLLLVFTVASSAVHVGLQVLLSELFDDRQYYKQCAIGFSGVIFALKVLTTQYWERGYRRYFGVRVSAKYAVWAELVLIQLLSPNASFVGHLAGILVGLAYTAGPLQWLMDAPVWLLSSVFQAASPASSTTSYSDWGSGVSGTAADAQETPLPENTSAGRPYGWVLDSNDVVDENDANYDEAVRRSYETLREETARAEEVRRRRMEHFGERRPSRY